MSFFKDMPKEQKQWVVLGVLGGLAGCYFFVDSVFSPLSESKEKLSQSIKPNDIELMKLRGIKSQRDEIETKFKRVSEYIGQNRAFFVPVENEMLWMTNIIRPICDQFGIKTESREVNTFGVQKDVGDGGPLLVESYMFQITINARLHQYGRFLAQLEKNVPIVDVKDVYISSTGDSSIKAVMTVALPRLTSKGRTVLQEGGLL